MTHFMSHQKVIYGVACLVPHRKGQDAGVNIEAGSLSLFVLYNQVFSSKEFGKLGFDFVLDCHEFVSYAPIIPNPHLTAGVLGDSSPIGWSRSDC